MGPGIVLGLITGLTTGMLAVGLVLVYKAGRFVNLAHGQLGALSALLMATWCINDGWSWWAAFPVAVGVGVVLGLLAERLFVRPLRNQGRRGTTMLLVTLGIGQLLLAMTFVPALAPDRTKLFRQQYPVPFHLHWRVLDADITAPHVMILLGVPVIVATLAAFLQWTTLGRSIRAAASNRDAARLCGVSVDSVNAITWGIAGALSAMTAILLAPSQSGFDATALGPALLLRALGAAALGGFVSIPAAMVGGIGLGLVEHITLSITSTTSSAELAVFLAVMVVLFLRGRQVSATAEVSDSVGEDRSAVRVPDAVADRFIVRSHRLLLGLIGIIVAAALPHLPYFSRTNNQFLLTMIVVSATIGVGLTMLLGWAGQVSLGHFALVGIGAFVATKFGDDHSIIALLLLAGLLGAATMTVVGIPALRQRGLTLAVTTLGLAVAGPAWLFAQPWFGVPGVQAVLVPDLGLRGFAGFGSQLATYNLAVVLLVLTAVVAGALRRSVPGRLIVAARDNDRALATFGVTPSAVKLATLAFSGFIAAAAGVVWAAAWHNVSVSLINPVQSLGLLAVPVVGGLGSIAGTIVGAFVIFLPTYFLAPQLGGLLGTFGKDLGFQLALGGLALVLIPLAYPEGIAGVGNRLWHRFLQHLDGTVSRWQRSEQATPLVVRDVTLAFGGVRALDEVSLDVRDGEIVGLIGPNGAGKTTLINVISGQLQPATGTIRVVGEDVTKFATELRSAYGLGRSYQDAHLFPGLTVAEAVQLAVSRMDRPGFLSAAFRAPWAVRADRISRADAVELLESMGLRPWSDALTSELSTGLRRMTDLAMQVAAKPRVLLLDEPTAGVAQREAEAFGPLLRKIRSDLGCSILIVEHDMPLLMGVCDRIYAMESGRIIAEGAPQEIRENPLVVASYLGADLTAIERSGPTKGRRSRALMAKA